MGSLGGSGWASSEPASSWEWLPRAARRALKRHRRRAGALPKGRFDHAAARMLEAGGLKAVRRLDTRRGERRRPGRRTPGATRGPGRSTLGPPLGVFRMVLQAEFGELVRPHSGTDGESLLPVLGARTPRGSRALDRPCGGPGRSGALNGGAASRRGRHWPRCRDSEGRTALLSETTNQASNFGESSAGERTRADTHRVRHRVGHELLLEVVVDERAWLD